MWDIERRPLLSEDNPEKSIHDYLDSRYELPGFSGALISREYARGAIRSRSVTRWRDRGRRVFAALGAWPWSVVPDGRLSRAWWREPRFADALSAWLRGELP